MHTHSMGPGVHGTILQSSVDELLMTIMASQVLQLEAKLKELDEERAELAQYQRVDKQKRSLEYAIYDKEISDIRSKLEQVHALQFQELPAASCPADLFPAAQQHRQWLGSQWCNAKRGVPDLLRIVHFLPVPKPIAEGCIEQQSDCWHKERSLQAGGPHQRPCG